MTDNLVSYQPDNCLRQGYHGLFSDIFRDLKANRWLTLQILRRDIFAMYKQSFAGLAWLLINPILSISTFMIMNRSGILKVGEITVPYPLFALLGTAFWQLFAVGIMASANSLVLAGSMISKINFSKKSLVIASIGSSLLSFTIQFVLVLILFAVYRTPPSIMILLAPLLTIPMVLLSLGIGFMVALLNAVVRDVGTAIPVVVQFLLFLTPVLYHPPGGIIGKAAHYNPLFYLATMPRDLILNGHSSLLCGYFVSAGFSLVVFLLCLTVFHLTESRVAERI